MLMRRSASNKKVQKDHWSSYMQWVKSQVKKEPQKSKLILFVPIKIETIFINLHLHVKTLHFLHSILVTP